jgi:hypothetical protein
LPMIHPSFEDGYLRADNGLVTFLRQRIGYTNVLWSRQRIGYMTVGHE